MLASTPSGTSPAHAEANTFLALAALAAVGVVLAITHVTNRHHAPA